MSLGRDELKKCFKAGALPTEEHFYGLIDSMLHMEDEGFRKTRQNGLEVTSALREEALVTFYRKEDKERPLWTLQHAGAGAQLNLYPVDLSITDEAKRPQPLLSLHNSGRVGIANTEPAHALDVAGVIASQARTGTYFQPDADKPPVPNGKWQVLARDLTRCVAFEVIASASGAEGQGRHAILHAIALNAYNPRLAGLNGYIDRVFNRKKRIKASSAWYGQRCDRLELAWERAPDAAKGNAKDERYQLVIRSQCDYGPGSEMTVRVTQLWPVDEAPLSELATALAPRVDKRTALQRKAERR